MVGPKLVWGVGEGSFISPSPPRAGIFGGLQGYPPPGPCHSQGSRISGGVVHGRIVPPPSSRVHRPTTSEPQARSMAVKTCSPSWPHWCGGPNGQTTLSGCHTSTGGGSPASMQEDRHLHKSRSPTAAHPA